MNETMLKLVLIIVAVIVIILFILVIGYIVERKYRHVNNPQKNNLVKVHPTS